MTPSHSSFPDDAATCHPQNPAKCAKQKNQPRTRNRGSAREMVQQGRKHHFLVVAFAAQGHINPALQLAKRLAIDGSADVTFATTVWGQRKMFAAAPPPPGPVSFLPFSDGHDSPFDPSSHNPNEYMARAKLAGYPSLLAAALSLSSAGRPLTFIIHTLVLPWVADVARDLAVPSALFWIQPAAVFAVYHHFFHGLDAVVSAHRHEPDFPLRLAAAPSLRVRDLPSFLSAGGHSFVLSSFRDVFMGLYRELEITQKNVRVLVNSFEELEEVHVAGVELVRVGPLLPSAVNNGEDNGDLLEPAAKEEYLNWLSSKAERSVVYVSFGSVSVPTERQREEIALALAESRRPFLWVVRGSRAATAAAEDCKLVEWCAQVEVLAHPAVGCFVTHCGWNSTIESLACGVPTVGLPQWTEQPTNARLAEATWRVGVTARVNAAGVVEAAELRRCVDLAMEPDGEIRKNALLWSLKAGEAVRPGGSSDRNLRAFLDSIHQESAVFSRSSSAHVV
ncbi:UDP-glycosyltransferase 75C1-like [Wolffia australiana]